MTDPVISALLSEHEERCLHIDAALGAVEKLQREIATHPWRLLRNWRLMAEAETLLRDNRQMLAMNKALLSRVRLLRQR